jgi:beta-N-acetylhexosaminidase
MLAFDGLELSGSVRSFLAEHDAAGFTLFRHRNVQSPDQVRNLTRRLQDAATRSELPLLVAADQEGGQLIGLGEGTTGFAGNMALGATGSPALAESVGRAIGRELRALGVNVNYAPVCDVATNPSNPSLGIRSFGDDPQAVAELVEATVRGLQAEGVAATLKHFPGKGEALVDPHHELPLLDLDLDRLDAVELVPFRAGIGAGARLVMVGHYAMPSVTEGSHLPTSLSGRVVTGLLRERMRFEGVAITDALDMHALRPGHDGVPDVVAAVQAGEDLLLCGPGGHAQDRIRAALELAADRGLLVPGVLTESRGRVSALRRWVGAFPQPDLEVVGCAEHSRLAREVAERSVTLVRDDAGLLPLRIEEGTKIAAIMPQPRDLTPADTSSTVSPSLAAALRRSHPGVEEFVTSHPPAASEISALRDRVSDFDLLVVGTIDAFRQPEQAALVKELVATSVPTVVVALRTPWDLAAYPEAATYACTYSILPASLEALTAALRGEVPFGGRLPAAIPGMYPRGHGLTR